MKVYLVLHHEIMGTPDDPHMDEMVFYVASSIDQAVEMIKTSGVSGWSWWEIQEAEVDNQDWPEHVSYYNLAGDKLKEKPPYEDCLELFRKSVYGEIK